MAKDESDNFDRVDSRVLSSARGLLVLVLPIGAAFGAYYGVRSALEARISENSRRLDGVSKDIEYIRGDIKDSRGDIERLRTNIDTHRNLGPDGLPHPQGVLRELADLEKRVQKLEAK